MKLLVEQKEGTRWWVIVAEEHDGTKTDLGYRIPLKEAADRMALRYSRPKSAKLLAERIEKMKQKALEPVVTRETQTATVTYPDGTKEEFDMPVEVKTYPGSERVDRTLMIPAAFRTRAKEKRPG
jgi:hypothetical protein